MKKLRKISDVLTPGERVPKELLKRWPHDYQEDAIDFMVSKKQGAIFLDMGLGKTMISLHAFLEFPKPVLLVGPIRVIETVWEKEAREWPATRNLTFSLLRGNPIQRKANSQIPADVYMVNPELLQEALDLRSDYKVLVVDESTMYSDPSTARFKRLKPHLRRFERRYILTATPSPNGLEQLWSQIYLLDLGARLDTAFSRFRDRYFYPDYMGFKWTPKEKSLERVTKKIRKLVFRLENPHPLPNINNIIPVVLPKKAQAYYNQMEREAFMELDKTEITAVNAAVVLGKLRQITAGFAYSRDEDQEQKTHQIHKEKIEEVRRVIDNTGSPVIVVYQFKAELEALKKAIPEGVQFSSEAQDKWDKGEIPVLFLHPQSGGHGLNLQYGGHTMIFCSSSFSLEQMQQIRGRISRTGQEFTPVFHSIVAVGTVDEILLDVLDKKAASQEEVLKLVQRHRKERRK